MNEEKSMANLEKGGKEYMTWIRKVASLCGGDPMYDIHLYGKDKLFEVWQSGIDAQDFFDKTIKIFLTKRIRHK